MPNRRIEHVHHRHPVVFVAADATIREVAQAMAAQQVGVAFVAEKNDVQGMITERDILEHLVAHGRDPATTHVADLMARSPATVSCENTVLDALQIMRNHGQRYLPVVRSGEIIGFVSMQDFVSPEVAGHARRMDFFARIMEG